MHRRRRKALTVIVIITFVLLLSLTKPKECRNPAALDPSFIKTFCTD